MRRVQRFDGEVVDDEQRYAYELLELALVQARGPRSVQLLEQFGLRDEQYVTPLPGRAVA